MCLDSRQVFRAGWFERRLPGMLSSAIVPSGLAWILSLLFPSLCYLAVVFNAVWLTGATCETQLKAP